jgi:hypothetical protein
MAVVIGGQGLAQGISDAQGDLRGTGLLTAVIGGLASSVANASTNANLLAEGTIHGTSQCAMITYQLQAFVTPIADSISDGSPIITQLLLTSKISA